MTDLERFNRAITKLEEIRDTWTRLMMQNAVEDALCDMYEFRNAIIVRGVDRLREMAEQEGIGHK